MQNAMRRIRTPLKECKGEVSLFKGQIGVFSTSNCSDLTVYAFGRALGQGAYATVREATHRPSGEKVAIK